MVVRADRHEGAVSPFPKRAKFNVGENGIPTNSAI